MKPLLKKSPFFLLALACTSAAGYTFHFIASRHLGPARYGEYTVLMALMLAFARPLEALSPAVARTIIENDRQDWKIFLRSFFHLSWIAGSIFAGTFFLFVLFLGPYLDLSFSIAVIFAGLTILFWSFLYVFRGMLQGHYKDISYVFNRPLELLGRLLCGSIFFIMGGGIAAAVSASFLGAIAGIFHIFAVIKNSFLGWKDFWKGKTENRLFIQFIKIMLIWLAGGFFVGLDMILVKRLFSPEESGIYAIANLIGKGVLVYAFTILPLLYPRLVKHRLRKGALPYMGIGVLYAAGIFLAAFLIFFLWGDSIIPFFFGQAYKKSAALIPFYLIAVFPISLHFGVINLKSAIGDWGECIFLWLALGLYFTILIYSPHEFNAYFWRIGTTQAALALSGFAFLLMREKIRTR